MKCRKSIKRFNLIVFSFFVSGTFIKTLALFSDKRSPIERIINKFTKTDFIFT